MTDRTKLIVRPLRRPLIVVLVVGVCVLTVSSCGDDDNNVLGLHGDVAGNPGDRAGDLLGDEDYTALTVQLQPASGMEPDPATVENLLEFLEARLNKPDGIDVTVATPIPSPGKSAYSISDVKTIEAQSRTVYSTGQTAGAYLLLIDGDSSESEGNSRILGHAYGPTSMVVYASAIQELSGGVGQPPRAVLEATVINHEFGHILGLVGTGSPVGDPSHHDQAHGAHCTNTECLMHYTVELSDVVANLLGGSIPQLDADCIHDLQLNGGK